MMKVLRQLIFLIGSSTVALAQDDSFRLDVNVDLVELHVSVTDERDRPVSGLTKESFRLTENGVEQTISVFKHEDQPVSLGLVVDNSRSIEPRKQRLDAAAAAFVRTNNRDDEAFVVHFDFDARLSQDFTSDMVGLEKVLSNAKPYGQTAMYDGLILAIDRMRESRYQKRAILLVTDGLDNSSKHSFEQTLEKLRELPVAVYTIGLLSATEGQKAEEILLKIADVSGGRTFFPANVEQVSSIVERIARDLREQYTVGYLPTNSGRDGTWRSVRVEVKPPPGFPPKLKINYRHGYYGAEK